jgi:hypothetical protein
MMAKLFSIVLSGLILIQSFDMAHSDIEQIDELLEHANFHAEKYGDNILVFISKHYGDLKDQHNKDHQEEMEDHEKLPFQNHCHASSITAIVANMACTELDPIQISNGSEANFYYLPLSSSLHTKGLFQPPQLA